MINEGFLGKIKFKRELKVVRGSKVHIWEVNSTSRGNSQMESQRGKSRLGVSKEQKGCQCVENRASKVERRMKQSERKQSPRFLGLWRNFEDFAFSVKKPLKRFE